MNTLEARVPCNAPVVILATSLHVSYGLCSPMVGITDLLSVWQQQYKQYSDYFSHQGLDRNSNNKRTVTIAFLKSAPDKGPQRPPDF